MSLNFYREEHPLERKLPWSISMAERKRENRQTGKLESASLHSPFSL